MELSNYTLLAVSDCLHYNQNGKTGNLNPIFTKQMDALFSCFKKVTLIAPLAKLDGNADKLSFYQNNVAQKLTYKPTPNVGGNTLLNKLRLALALLSWIKLFFKNSKHDLIYLRMPNNLNIISFLIFILLRKKIFITYTGTWANYPNEPFTYKLQKWYIKYLHKGPAFVYQPKSSSNQLYRIIPSYSPSHSINEINKAFNPNNLINKHNKLNLITVGAVTGYKNQMQALQILKLLISNNYNAYLTIVGKPTAYKQTLQHFIDDNMLEARVCFTGELNGNELAAVYQQSHLLIHTPIIEGYGKTIQEGFCYNLPAILSDFPFAHYFKGNTNRVFILKQDINNEQQLLNFVNRYIYDKEFKNEISAQIKLFLNQHHIEHWVKSYQNAISTQLLKTHVS